MIRRYAVVAMALTGSMACGGEEGTTTGGPAAETAPAPAAAERKYLLESTGKPRVSTSSVLIYDEQLPNLMVVVQDDPKSEQGKKGVGVLAVRYYDPR